MNEQLYKILNKENLKQFSNSLKRSSKLYAPVKTSKESHSFMNVDSLEEADLDYTRTMIPPKKFFIPPNETIFSFNKEKEEYYEIPITSESIVLFGVHPCDLNAFNLLAKVYLEVFTDKYYNKR